MRICFDELRRAQEISPEPNFLVLLGYHYGWRPLPEGIPAMVFEALEKVVTTNFMRTTKRILGQNSRLMNGFGWIYKFVAGQNPPHKQT